MADESENTPEPDPPSRENRETRSGGSPGDSPNLLQQLTPPGGRNIWYGILAATSIIPCLGTLTGLVGLVLLIILLVKANGYRTQIEQAGSSEANR